MKVFYIKNFRKGLATNSSSTHSIIYRNEGELFEDLNIFELDYYDRCTRTIAATREAKIKYIAAYAYMNDDLMELLSTRFPEMKEYFPLIEKTIKEGDDYYYDDVFGMYCRGDLSHNIYEGTPENNLFNYEYLSNIIEDDEAIIIGGSDEEDFVCDTKEGHVEAPFVSEYDFVIGKKYKSYIPVKNGNYWVGFGKTYDGVNRYRLHTNDKEFTNKNSSQGRLRFATTKDEPIPEYPELIDLRITNKCDHGCPFCFMGSSMSEKHANFDYLNDLILKLKDHRTEFSIGGGNILLYPHLNKLFKLMKERGHIVNVTINAKDCETVMTKKKFRDIFKNYVDGIGISVTNMEEAEMANKFYHFWRGNISDLVFDDEDKKGFDPTKYVAVHLIPEYIGIEMTNDIMNKYKEIPYLFLGYKTNERGASQEYCKFNDDELEKIFSVNTDWSEISIDTTFANRYDKWLDGKYFTKLTMTRNEGEFSMYIDGVHKLAYKSSYQLEKPYKIGVWVKGEGYPDIRRVFSKIRKDNGFKVFDEDTKKYYEK